MEKTKISGKQAGSKWEIGPGKVDSIWAKQKKRDSNVGGERGQQGNGHGGKIEPNERVRRGKNYKVDNGAEK